jgi:hypothetical protein
VGSSPAAPTARENVRELGWVERVRFRAALGVFTDAVVEVRWYFAGVSWRTRSVVRAGNDTNSAKW